MPATLCAYMQVLELRLKSVSPWQQTGVRLLSLCVYSIQVHELQTHNIDTQYCLLSCISILFVVGAHSRHATIMNAHKVSGQYM